MEKKKIYQNMKIEKEIYLNFADYKRIFELQEKKSVTFSELLHRLIKDKHINLAKLPIEI